MSLEIANTHYVALRGFLAAHIVREQNHGTSAQRLSAREKLKRLSQLHFLELSTDVYDELTRRLLNSTSVPFLPVKDEYHPKRNQARQKLATLPKSRFKDLASDVYAELDRRYPQFSKEWKKSDDLKDPPVSTRSVGTTSSAAETETFNPITSSPLNGVTANSNGWTQESVMDIYNEIIPEKMQAVMVEEDLEYTVHENIFSHFSDKEESEDKYSLAPTVRPSTAQDRRKPSIDETRLLDLRRKNFELEERCRFLEAEVASFHRKPAEEVRDLLERIRILTKQNEELMEFKKLSTNRSKTPIDEPQTPRRILRKNEPDLQMFLSLTDEQGLLNEERIIEIYKNVENLYVASQKEKSVGILESMKKFMNSTRYITDEIDYCVQNGGKGRATPDKLEALRVNFSKMLAALYSTVKQHAAANGQTPIAAVETAISQFLKALMEVVQALRLRSKGRTISPVVGKEKVASVQTGGVDRKEFENLKTYISQRTDAIVHAIQSMLSTMRGNYQVDLEEIAEIVESINDIVHNVVKVSKKNFAKPEWQKYKIQGDLILEKLEQSNENLMELREELPLAGKTGNERIQKQQLASVSFDLARYTKELLGLLDS